MGFAHALSFWSSDEKVTSMGKVRLRDGVTIDRWRIEGRTVLHQSWSGITWRKKGSAMAYTAGCRFEKKPAFPTLWTVAVDGYEPSPLSPNRPW